MDETAATEVLLDPNPDFIVELVGKVVGQTWPEDPGGLGEYLAGIGCMPLPPRPGDLVEPSTEGNLTMPGIEMENGSWAALKGRLFSLNFFFYPGPQVLPGYEDVRQGLIDAYGVPLEETRQGNRSAVWCVGETMIELYGHVTVAPVLQLGPGHRELSRVYNDVVRSLPGSDPQ
ncbi:MULTISPECIES: hypothetical protein [unclassified Arthrobacter]|uniref:hypothetical protein n=1 Tax=unclassified Arthrobacter TaxID=235627 RepID=UPI001E5BB114|nr:MULTISPECIES: hypothetical protein [unclassified Arthrobacter]MCC9145167.1 hypothetical protein [Arthrobacter sp. zg-Y919]MDK1276395.1 hypothetical protein [Arthrobacter sp. zg.Y919]WIB02004.1 hypothetical protein QNO10_08415 [Arthrobacter sp. zg-Y919]